MRALTWQGKHDVRVETVPDPQIINPRDAIIQITSTAICGSDLHLYDHYIQGMKSGDVLGHEFMGEVVEVGSGNKKLKVGERVVVPFVIACGGCFFCRKQQFAACDNSNPADKSDASEMAYGYPMAAAFGYSHLTGGYSGGQAEYVRVPYSDVGPLVVPEGIDDDKVLFLSDILPTGWMAAVNCDIEPGDTVAVWGCGPVGLFAVQSALLLGAHRVIAIDHHPRRLALAKQLGAEILDFEQVEVREALAEMTGGIGPDACIDAVGMESHGMTPDNMLDHVKVKTFMATDRVHALRQVILATRKGGRVSIPGVYGGIADKFPIGALMEKGLTIKSGQTHVQKFMPQLLDLILEDKLDTTFLISHRLDLEDAAEGYKNFKEKQNEYTKVVLETPVHSPLRKDWDVVIAGAGPAGLSAALVLGRASRRVLLCDTGTPRSWASKEMHAYLSRDGIPPSRFLDIGRHEALKYPGVKFAAVEVLGAKREGTKFVVQFARRQPVHTRKLLIATGVFDIVPRIPGIDELFGRTVFQCPYCDGWEMRGKRIAVYGKRQRGFQMARAMTSWARDIVLCTDGRAGYKKSEREQLERNGITVIEKRIASLEGSRGKLRAVVFRDGDRLPRDALFFDTPSRSQSKLAQSLGCQFGRNGGVLCGDYEATSVPGVFVAGNIIRDVQLSIVAAAEGARAAFGINRALTREDFEQRATGKRRIEHPGPRNSRGADR